MLQKIETKYKVTGFADSRIGGRSENQDTCAFTDTPVGLLVLVCDGMGGGPGGKTASFLAAKAITDYMLSLKPTADVPVALEKAINLANKAITDYTVEKPALKGMGSTVVALVVNDYAAYMAHIGDSRIYQLRGHSVLFRTTDHSKVMGLVKSKVLTEEQARLSGESNIITQALGHTKDLKPEITEHAYQKGDRFVLCSDGIWGVFPQKELVRQLTGPKNPAGAVDNVVISVDNAGMESGGHHDNLTVAIVDTQSNSQLKEKMTKKTKLMMSVLGVICALSIILNIILISSRPKAAAPAVQTNEAASAQNVDSIVDAKLKQQRDAFKVQLDSLEKQIKKSDDRGLESTLKDIRRSNDLASQIQSAIDMLEVVKNMDKGPAKNQKVKEVIDLLSKLESQVASSAPGAGKNVKAAVDYAKQPTTLESPKEKNGRSVGHVNRIEQLLREASASLI